MAYENLSKAELIEELTAANERVEELENHLQEGADLLDDDDDAAGDEE
jgi:hypothetical protein